MKRKNNYGIQTYAPQAARTIARGVPCYPPTIDSRSAFAPTYLRSVIAFGKIHIVESQEELIAGLRLLGERFNPGDHAGLQHEIDTSVAMPGGMSHTRVAVLRMDIEHLSGKEAIELVRVRKQRE